MKLPYPPCYPLCSCEPWHEGLILQPWAFWTSLLYFVALWFVIRKDRKVSKEWISAVIIVGLASLLAHASFDLYSLAVDESAVVVVLFSYHLNSKSWPRALLTNLLIMLIFTAIFTPLPFGTWVPVVVLAFAVSAWLAIRKRGTKIFRDREFITAMAIYFVSFLLFRFDQHPLLCEMEWFPYGHPTWHAGSALVIFLLGDWWFKEDHRDTATSHP